MTALSLFVSRSLLTGLRVLGVLAATTWLAEASDQHATLVMGAQHYFSQDPVVIVKGKTQMHALPSGDPVLKAIGFDPTYFQNHDPDGVLPDSASSDDGKGFIVFWYSSSIKNCSASAQSSTLAWHLPDGSPCLRSGYQVVVSLDSHGDPTRLVIEQLHSITN